MLPPPSASINRAVASRYLTVPSLNDRREDIPLFGERFGDGHRPDERFLLTLLQNDWRSLEVDGLITAVTTAVSRTPDGQPLTLDSLNGSVPAELRRRIAALDEGEVGSSLYRFLLDLLRQHGSEPGARGRSPNVRLAQLMGVDKSTIGRRLKGYGLGPADGGE